jgi:hypothetical protein
VGKLRVVKKWLSSQEEDKGSLLKRHLGQKQAFAKSKGGFYLKLRRSIMLGKVFCLVCFAAVLGMVSSASAMLVARHEFEGNANDSSGNGNNGSLMGNAIIKD